MLTRESILSIVQKALKDHLNFDIASTDISILHRLQKKNRPGPDNRDIMIKFCRREMKKNLLIKACCAKVDGIYINEALTPLRRSIAYVLRKAKRKFPNIISGSTTFEGKNVAWIKAPDPNARPMKLALHTKEKFLKFCQQTLKKPVTHFVKEWPY